MQRRPTLILAFLALIQLFVATAARPEKVSLARGPEGQARLTLSPSLAPSWSEVHVGRLVVRSGGIQKRLAAGPLPRSRHLDVATPAGECALLLADLAPATGAELDPPAYAAKLVACPAADHPEAYAARLRAGGLLTAKTGSRIELRPLLNPATLRPDRDLPIRAYHGGDARGGAILVATGPGGTETRAVADRHGIATLRVPAAGRWTVRYQPDGGRGAEASLEFDVPPASFWDRQLAKEAVR